MWGYTTTLRKTEEMSKGGARETEEKKEGQKKQTQGEAVDTTKNPVNV